jgi:hypothetical protein
MKLYSIPLCLVVNNDQTRIHLIPIARERKWESKGTKHIQVLKVEDKKQVWCFFCYKWMPTSYTSYIYKYYAYMLVTFKWGKNQMHHIQLASYIQWKSLVYVANNKRLCQQYFSHLLKQSNPISWLIKKLETCMVDLLLECSKK